MSEAEVPLGLPLVRATDVTKTFRVRDRGGSARHITAVDRVSLEVFPGETLAVVGESGSGKSTLGRAILQLDTPTSGSVEFEGTELTTLRPRERRAFQRKMQIIFQDPYASLNPGRTALQQVLEPVQLAHESDPVARATWALEQVGITGEQVHKLPRAFSGGQRQRIAIARAISVRPSLIVCDEPVSALDMSIQAQITVLLRELQAELGLSYIFISHDLAVVREIAHQTAVMYRGRIVELGATETIFGSPQHPYTKRLLGAILVPDPAVARVRLQQLSAQVSEPLELDPAGGLVEVSRGHFVYR